MCGIFTSGYRGFMGRWLLGGRLRARLGLACSVRREPRGSIWPKRSRCFNNPRLGRATDATGEQDFELFDLGVEGLYLFFTSGEALTKPMKLRLCHVALRLRQRRTRTAGVVRCRRLQKPGQPCNLPAQSPLALLAALLRGAECTFPLLRLRLHGEMELTTQAVSILREHKKRLALKKQD